MTRQEVITALEEGNIAFKTGTTSDAIIMSFDNDRKIVLKEFDDDLETCVIESRDLISNELLSRETVDCSSVISEILQY